MRKKYISLKDYQKNILPHTQISFGTISPFIAVTFPPNKTLFGAWYGNLSPASGPSVAIGTLEVARRGEGTVIIDFEKYPFYSTGTATVIEIVGPQRPSYHWSPDIPSHLGNQAPQWVDDLVNKEIGRRLSRE